MGKKYLPVIIQGKEHKIHLEDLKKIYKKLSKVEKPIPSYQKIAILRKTTQETSQGDDTPFLEEEEDSFQI